MFKTAFKRPCFELVTDICQKTKGPLIDVPLWKRWEGDKFLMAQQRPPIAVGIKGLPGRVGTTSGWRPTRNGYAPDLNGEYLRRIINNDIENYMTLFPQQTRAVTPDLSYEQEEDQRYSWLYSEGPYAKPGISMFRLAKFVDWAKNTTDLEHQNVVDLGCGRAELSKLLPYKTYTGVDISSYQINKNIAENEQPNSTFIRHSIDKLPYEDMAFDVAICTDVMEHVPENRVDRVLKEMFRVAHSVMLVIDCAAAKLTDKNGKNLHCTIQPYRWWMKKIKELGVIRYEDWQDDKLTLFCGSGYKSQGVFPDHVFGVRLRRHPDGSVWLPRSNRKVERYMDEHFLRAGRELRWHYPIDEPMRIENLKGLYAGKPCYIVGKGPSLDHLKPSDLGDGPVIAINESVHQVEKLVPCPEDLYLMQQDTGINCRPKVAVPLLYFYIKHLYPEIKQRFVFTDTDFGRQRHGLTVLVAIACAKYMGCTSIVLVSFDACVNKQTGYAKCIGHSPAKTHSGSEKRFLKHRRLIEQEAGRLPLVWQIPVESAD